jgi:hypothetical protein
LGQPDRGYGCDLAVAASRALDSCAAGSTVVAIGSAGWLTPRSVSQPAVGRCYGWVGWPGWEFWKQATSYCETDFGFFEFCGWLPA